GSSVTWVFSGAFTYTFVPGNITGPSVSITPTVSTTYTLLGSNGTCTSSKTLAVTVLPPPSVSVGGNSVICAGLPTNLTAFGAVTYTWIPIAQVGSVVIVSPTVSTC